MKIGKYTIETTLGKGAMGIVYKARDPSLDESVAIKLIRHELADASMLQRVKREALICRKLKHPNIVGTYDFSAGNPCYIVMEFVDGRELKEYLDEGYVFSDEDIFKIISQVLSALAYAHKVGITHRDIKPANIMVGNHRKTLVADFGIAKLDNSNLTLDGSIIGTPNYMSPEQCLGKTVDTRSDLFSTGSVLYQLLTGEKPFKGENYMDTMRKVLDFSPPKPSQLNCKISPAIDAVVEKALAKKPGNRFQSASEFRQALKVALIVKSPSKPEKKTKTLIASSVLIAILALGAYRYIPGFYLPKPQTQTHKFKENLSEEPTFAFHNARLNALFANFTCSQLKVDFKDQKIVMLTGYVRSEDMGLLKKQVKALMLEVPYEFQVEPESRPYCTQELLLAEAEQRNQTQHHGLQLEPYNHDNIYIKGEFLEYKIMTPDYSAYIYVDYYQSDGTVVHLVPNMDIKLPISAQEEFILGEASKGKKQWEVYPPFGQDMVTIIASSSPLFTVNRKEVEMTNIYLSDLKNSFMKNRIGILTANHFFVNTRLK